MTLRERLAAVAGVWDGTYRHYGADGTLVDQHGSHQETRLDGDDWYERVAYLRLGAEPEVHDFRARFVGDDELDFGSAAFVGRTTIVDDRHLVFPYRWTADPGLELVELITFVDDAYRSRVWQAFRDGRLERLTVIEEHRVPGAAVEVWT